MHAFLVLNDEQCFGGFQSVYRLMGINNSKLGQSDVRWLAKNQIVGQTGLQLRHHSIIATGSCFTMEFGISKRLSDHLALS